MPSERCSLCRQRPSDSNALVRAPYGFVCAACVRVGSDMIRARSLNGSFGSSICGAPTWMEDRILRGLPAQPRTAALVSRMIGERRHGRPAPRSALLLGPCGSGKSRTLGLVASIVGESYAGIDLGPGSVSAARERGPTVVAIDELEARLERADALLELEAALAWSGEEGGPQLLVAMAIVGDVAASGGSVAARIGGRSHAIDDGAANALGAALARGLPTRLLARFDLLVWLEPLDGARLATILEDADFIQGCCLNPDFRLQIGPEASAWIVDHALQLGGGAWGLQATLVAIGSSLLASMDERGWRAEPMAAPEGSAART